MIWNPFDWTAGPFLTLYLFLAAIVFLVGFRLKSMIGPLAHATPQLSVLELAYLAGGARRLADAVLLRLTSGNGATIDTKGQKITITDQTPLATLMSRLPVLAFYPDMTRQQFQRAVGPIVERVQGRLQQLGYYPTDEQMMSFRMTVLPFVGLLMLFGDLQGLCRRGTSPSSRVSGFPSHRHRFASFVLARRPTRTRAGNDVLQAYQASHARPLTGAARSRIAARRSALRGRRPVGYPLCVGLCCFEDDGQRWRRWRWKRLRRRWWRRRMRRLQRLASAVSRPIVELIRACGTTSSNRQRLSRKVVVSPTC